LEINPSVSLLLGLFSTFSGHHLVPSVREQSRILAKASIRPSYTHEVVTGMLGMAGTRRNMGGKVKRRTTHEEVFYALFF